MTKSRELESKIVDIAQWNEARLLLERRRHERAILSQAIQGELIMDVENLPLPIGLIQLSRGGCSFSLIRPLRETSFKVGDTIALTLSLGSGIQIETKARIAHITSHLQEGKSPIFGAEFDIKENESDSTIPRLVDFLESYVRSQVVPLRKSGS